MIWHSNLTGQPGASFMNGSYAFFIFFAPAVEKYGSPLLLNSRLKWQVSLPATDENTKAQGRKYLAQGWVLWTQNLSFHIKCTFHYTRLYLGKGASSWKGLGERWLCWPKLWRHNLECCALLLAVQDEPMVMISTWVSVLFFSWVVKSMFHTQMRWVSLWKPPCLPDPSPHVPDLLTAPSLRPLVAICNACLLPQISSLLNAVCLMHLC